MSRLSMPKAWSCLLFLGSAGCHPKPIRREFCSHQRLPALPWRAVILFPASPSVFLRVPLFVQENGVSVSIGQEPISGGLCARRSPIAGAAGHLRDGAARKFFSIAAMFSFASEDGDKLVVQSSRRAPTSPTFLRFSTLRDYLMNTADIVSASGLQISDDDAIFFSRAPASDCRSKCSIIKASY